LQFKKRLTEGEREIKLREREIDVFNVFSFENEIKNVLFSSYIS